MQNLTLLATAATGVEAVVRRELEQLGYPARVVQPGRLGFSGDLEALARANLWLRAADRVLLELGRFPATDFGQLFDQTKALPWSEWIPANGGVLVKGRSHGSQLSSVPACQRIVKKAIVEQLLAGHSVTSLPEDGPQFTVEVSLRSDEALLTLDTSGAGLHKRGYREIAGPAPLKETLAAAILMLSVWRPERPLIDPFCGSGTIAIEAALLARSIAPGLHRTFAAEDWPAIPVNIWKAAREEAQAKIQPSLPEQIMGTDIEPDAVRLARYHAEQAGVAEDIHFQQREFSQLTSKRRYGCVITNPPYGARQGEDAEMDALYRSMPVVLRRLETWSHYLLVARRDFEDLIGQKATKRRKLYNARIECTLYQFLGPKPPRRRRDDPIDDPGVADEEATSDESIRSDPTSEVTPERIESAAAANVEVATDAAGTEEFADTARPAIEQSPEQPLERDGGNGTASQDTVTSLPNAQGKPQSKLGGPVFGGLDDKAREQGELFRRRLAKRIRHLRRWPKQGITCFRLYDRDIPEIPLAVDRYEQQLHIAEYERPHERSPAEHADWLDMLVKVASEECGMHPRDVFVKYRSRQRGLSQYERQNASGAKSIVHEGGLKFQINLADYLDTGLFLDHRLTRDMVRQQASDKRFLNLFCYTGAFTVYAAAGGASETTSVDLSANYLQWAHENLKLNDFPLGRHRLLESDVMQFLTELPEAPLYDLAVIDPPTFSNTKKKELVWDVQRDHAQLLSLTIARMSPGGVIYFSTNFRRFKMDETVLTGCTWREISRQTVPPDFRNRRIHRCWRIVTA